MPCLHAPFTLILIMTVACAVAAARARQMKTRDDVPPAATQPATVPATRPADVSPDAQALLDRVGDAYAKLPSLDVAGTFALELDVAGQKQTKRAALTGSFVAPNKLRHEMTDDALVVCTGAKAYLYLAKPGKYAEAAAPEARAESAGLAEPLADVLRAQNPSLYLAMCASAPDELLDGATSVTKLDDVRIGEVHCPTLQVRTEKQVIRASFDPTTHLLRRMTFDLSRSLTDRGVPDVTRATITIDYEMAKPGAPVPAERFEWSPPPDATLARATERTGAVEGDAQAMQGKAAPEFALEDLEGKRTSLKDLRGRVVVLDFWATWCGPCRASLPHLEQLHKDLSGAGVHVLAINLREGKDVARRFVEETGLTMPVLLDETGRVAERYAVSGIPHTVVIDKSGVVRDVLVGFAPDTPRELRQAVDAANAAR